MRELIDRQTVLELVDRGFLISNGNYKQVRKLIEQIPTVTRMQEDSYQRLIGKRSGGQKNDRNG